VKRILIAAVLALGIHGLLLGMECGRLKRIQLERPQPRVMTMTLVLRQPKVPVSKLVIKSPNVESKKPVIVKKVKKEPKHKPFPKPKPKKIIKADVQPPEKELSKEIPEKTFAESKTPVKPEQTVFKESAKKEISMSVKQIVREAIPLYRTNPSPKYPGIAKRRGYQGSVVLEVLVGRSGSVVDLRVFLSSGYPILDRAAVATVKNWIFEPAMKGEKKVEMWVRVPIRFKLK
jgi:protein TonB